MFVCTHIVYDICEQSKIHMNAQADALYNFDKGFLNLNYAKERDEMINIIIITPIGLNFASRENCLEHSKHFDFGDDVRESWI